jgi:hypothetical protein
MRSLASSRNQLRDLSASYFENQRPGSLIQSHLDPQFKELFLKRRRYGLVLLAFALAVATAEALQLGARVSF